MQQLFLRGGQNMNNKRVVITGIGMITPVGNSTEETFNNLLNGNSGITKVTLCDTSDIDVKIAGEVKFDPSKYLDNKQQKRMDRFTQLAIIAANEAVADSNLDIKQVSNETGVIIGCGIGGLTTLEEQYNVLVNKGPQRISPLLVPMYIADMAAGQISIQHGAKGPSLDTVSACASGTDAVGSAYEIIKRGDSTAMIAGGTEAAITRLGLSAFRASRTLSIKDNDNPEKASKPFDKNRDGFVLAEGASILILEEKEHAENRKAKIYAEIVSYSQTSDAFHITQPSENGEGAVRAMNKALLKAKIDHQEIDYINAHGTSTVLNDKNETAAIKKVFSEHAYEIPINSTKSMVGHTLGAAGAIEASVTALSVKNQKIHPTINLNNPDEDCDLDYVIEGKRELKINYAMSNSFGFGGHNGVLIFKQYK